MSNRIKILIFIDWFLPGTLSGGPVRSYANLIEHLKDDFEFYIITRNSDYGSTIPYEGIVPDTWTELNHYTKVYYISKEALNKKHLKRVIAVIEFDLAYINGMYSWYFSILPVLLLKKSNKPIIVSARGMLNPQAFSVKGTKKKVFLKLAKLLGFYRAINFHATNDDEAKHIKAHIGANTKILVAPNLPRLVKKEEQPISHKKHNPIRFVNIARVAIEKGTLNMLNVLKNIKQIIQLDIYGPIYDDAYWEKCLKIIEDLPNNIEVNYKGVLVSDEVPIVLKRYDFFVLLSEGENFGHAILEGLSAGCPVIISNRTPWRNLESKQIGWDIEVEDKNTILETFQKAIDMDQQTYQSWSLSALIYAKNFINNPEILEQNKALFYDAT